LSSRKRFPREGKKRAGKKKQRNYTDLGTGQRLQREPVELEKKRRGDKDWGTAKGDARSLRKGCRGGKYNQYLGRKKKK